MTYDADQKLADYTVQTKWESETGSIYKKERRKIKCFGIKGVRILKLLSYAISVSLFHLKSHYNDDDGYYYC